MTLKIVIVNDAGNPSDRVVEVERQGVYMTAKTVIKAGESMEGMVYDGSEYHAKEIPPPADE
jgi:hypothetical protein